MHKEMKKYLTGFMLTAAFAMAGSAGAASIGDCPGGVTLKANGVMECVGGAAPLSTCAGNFVLDTVGAVGCSVALLPPSCTLTPVSSSIASGATATLTASCNPTPTSYTWTGGVCAGRTTATCTVTGGQTAGTTTYTVKGANAAGTGTAATAAVTVTTSSSSGAPAAPATSTPTCTLSQMVFGAKISLSASCSPAATSYAWGNTGFASTSSNGLIDPPAATTTYSVTGSNAIGAGNTSSVTVTVANTCSLSASTASIYQGQSSTLTASCTPATGGYDWHGACAGTTDTCVVSPNSTTAYTVTGTSGNTATSAPLTVNVTAPTCTVTASASTIAVGESATLTASCAPAATAYNWNGACDAGNTSNTCIVTPGAPGAPTYTVTGTGANTATSAPKTVNVVAPFCSVTASPSTIALSLTSTLTAVCHPAATAYNWNGACDAGNTSNTCVVTPGAVGAPTYTVTGTVTNTDTSDPVTVTVVPPSCSVTASPSTISVGQSTTLTASCSPAAAANGYNWNGACGGTGSTCTVTPGAAGTPSYTVTGTVGGTPVTSPAVNVTVTAQQCSTSAVTWAPGLAPYGPGNTTGTPWQIINPAQQQAFSLAQSSRPARAIAITYGQCRLELSISPTACDFGAHLVAQGCAGLGIDPSVVAQTSDQAPVGGVCVLQQNQTYYLNVREQAGFESNNCGYYLAW